MQIFKSLGIGLSLLLLPVCASAADGGPRAGLQMVRIDEMPAPTDWLTCRPPSAPTASGHLTS